MFLQHRTPESRTRRRATAPLSPSGTGPFAVPGPAPETPESRWEHFPHDADVGVRGYGATPSAAFEQAALALTAAVTAPESVRPAQAVSLDARAPDLELLLVEWLNALVFEMAERQMLFGAFAVTLDGLHLTAQAFGESVDRERHSPAVEVKGATLTGLEVVEERPGLWRAQCVIDV